MSQSQFDVFNEAKQLIKTCTLNLEDDVESNDKSIDKLPVEIKEQCIRLNGNRLERKKVQSLLANYFAHQQDLRQFYRDHKLKVKKQKYDLSKTMLYLVLAERLFCRHENRKLYEHLPEAKYLATFEQQIERKRSEHGFEATIEIDAAQKANNKRLKRKRKAQVERKKLSDPDTRSNSSSTKKAKQVDQDLFAHEKRIPVKYLRINRIKTDSDAVVRELTNNHDLVQVGRNCDSFTTFLKRLFNLKETEFMCDFHFPADLIVVHGDTSGYIQATRMYAQGEIIFQDKASLLPLHCVPLTAGWRVGDICCAPGMKTAAIASKTNNQVTMYSIDKDETRLQSMRELMDWLGVTCTQIAQKDFTECTNRDFAPDDSTDQHLDVIFLDPSCSGSGILKRADEENDDRLRLLKLASFQTKMIGHAMSLRPKWLVYSTCSNSVWENEFVVCKALEQSSNATDYELCEALPEWPQRGNKKFWCHEKVIRTGPNRGTQGFFTAVFKRIN